MYVGLTHNETIEIDWTQSLSALNSTTQIAQAVSLLLKRELHENVTATISLCLHG